MLDSQTRSASLALALAALASLAGTAVLGQSSGDDETRDRAARDQAAVAVTGTSTLVGQASPGTTTVDGSIIRVRDNVLITVEESSDPRVQGRTTIKVNFDSYPDEAGLPGTTQVRYGEARLENEAGAWTGRFAGSLTNGGFVQTYWLEGEAAYEGLSYVVTSGGSGNVWRSQGLVFPGDLPPLGVGNRLPIDGPDLELPTAWTRLSDS
jgi:hypothetical protein